MIGRSPCSRASIEEVFGSWCPLYNSAISFGIFSMIVYGFAIILDVFTCCGSEVGGRESRTEMTSSTSAAQGRSNSPAPVGQWPPKNQEHVPKVTPAASAEKAPKKPDRPFKTGVDLAEIKTDILNEKSSSSKPAVIPELPPTYESSSNTQGRKPVWPPPE
jgi:hypothetical protein